MLQLGKREREIVEVVYRLDEASVAQVRDSLVAPPTYSAVRGMLNSLVEKRILRVRQEGKRYLYRPLESKNKVGLSALRELVRNFFGGQPSDAVAALLEGGASRLSPEEIARIKQLIDQAENAP